ncbi:hypothetical protein [Agrobacterium sp. SORGH_AS 787]|uniref:hypothetical protein n=1 Tax=Agrobacterium sp. SORGH_AS 787 TaxID=3041775 RepID=UPI002785E6BA|nr:hypothetical protein [Rhizobium sp. SORGH_AS_0787]
MRKPIRQRIEELEQQKRTLQLRLDRQERAQERRRTMLLGAFLLEQLRLDHDAEHMRGQDLKDWLARTLPSFVKRDADRALFADLLTDDKTAREQASLIAAGGDRHDNEGCDSRGDDNEGGGLFARNRRRDDRSDHVGGDRDCDDSDETVHHGDDRP